MLLFSDALELLVSKPAHGRKYCCEHDRNCLRMPTKNRIVPTKFLSVLYEVRQMPHFVKKILRGMS